MMRKQVKCSNRLEYASFLRNALALKGSVTPKVFIRVICVVAYSMWISFLYHFIPSISLYIGPFEYAGFIMGLILAFRLNSCYERWWEARKIWGNVVNQSRNLAVIITNYCSAQDMLWKIKVTNYIIALPYLMKNNLRAQSSIDEIRHLVEPSVYAMLEQVMHKPNALLSIIAKELHIYHMNQQLDSFSFLQAEEKRAFLLDCQGACERILKTPMPFVMVVKLKRFIFLFLIALPFAMVDVSVMISPLITGLVAYALFSLDQVGFELQNPFVEDRLSHLPLDAICETIEKNIVEIRKLQRDEES